MAPRARVPTPRRAAHAWALAAALLLACDAGGGAAAGDLGADGADAADAADEVPGDDAADVPGDLPDAEEPDAEEPGDADAAPAAGPLACAVRYDVPATVPLVEASGAVWVASPLGTGWLVVADSGNQGAALLLDLEGWQSVPLALPLDAAAGDDVEGLALAPDGSLVGLTSAGWVREWRLEAAGPHLARLARPISEDPSWTCDAQGVNCAANFEGLCLDPAPGPPPACAGFAVSKALGLLVCVERDEAGWRLDPARTVAVGEPDGLSGCDYELEPPHRLVVAGNLYSESALWEVRGHRDPATAQAVLLEPTGPFNQEAVGFGPGGLLLAFGDAQDLFEDASPLTALTCE